MTSEEKAAAAGGGGGGGGERLLAKVRSKEQMYADLVKTNSETFRLSNDGRFPVKVSLAFEDQPQVNVVAERVKVKANDYVRQFSIPFGSRSLCIGDRTRQTEQFVC